jgi:hypothetical protein
VPIFGRRPRYSESHCSTRWLGYRRARVQRPRRRGADAGGDRG